MQKSGKNWLKTGRDFVFDPEVGAGTVLFSIFSGLWFIISATCC